VVALIDRQLRVNIGDFSRMTFLSVKALHHYHDVGLLLPAEIDPDTGYRRYDVKQVPTAQVIRRLRELGMPLDDVRAVIEAADVSGRNAALSAHLRRMEGELEQTRATVNSLRLLLDEGAPSTVAITYRTDEPSRALAIRGEIAHDEMFPWLEGAFAELHAALEQRADVDGALFSGELMEDEFGEIVALVPGAGPTSGRIHMHELPGIEYAVAVHTGPLEEVDLTYAALGTVVAERAIGLDGPLRENYLSEDRIEICWPVFQTAPPMA
jgi:DNA-binding transcriptional MerR regulator